MNEKKMITSLIDVGFDLTKGEVDESLYQTWVDCSTLALKECIPNESRFSEAYFYYLKMILKISVSKAEPKRKILTCLDYIISIRNEM